MRKISLIIFALGVLLPALAEASDYAFKLHNRAEGYTIKGFYTYQNGKWSDNWLSERIRPGDHANLDWASNKGSCVVPFRVAWEDYGSEDFKVDWCKGISNVYMKDKGFSWD